MVGWRRADGRQGFCAVRGGLLTVTGGNQVSVAAREAVPGDDLAALEALVRGRMASEAEAERRAAPMPSSCASRRIRQIIGYLRPNGPGAGRRP